MRTIDVSEITENIKEMCMEANHYLSKDMDNDCLLYTSDAADEL